MPPFTIEAVDENVRIMQVQSVNGVNQTKAIVFSKAAAMQLRDWFDDYCTGPDAPAPARINS